MGSCDSPLQRGPGGAQSPLDQLSYGAVATKTWNPVEFCRCAAVVAAQHAHVGEPDCGEQRNDLVRGVHVHDEVVSLVRDEFVSGPGPPPSPPVVVELADLADLVVEQQSAVVWGPVNRGALSNTTSKQPVIEAVR